MGLVTEYIMFLPWRNRQEKEDCKIIAYCKAWGYDAGGMANQTA